MSKNLIFTRANDNIKDMCAITHPVLKKYANRCEADFIVIDKDITGLHSHWRILNIYELFNKYDRIAGIDSDVLILKKCPDIFKTVAIDSFGSIFEDKGSRLQDRRDRIKKANIRYGDIGWKEGYINTGVFVMSKIHRNILEYTKDTLWNDLGYDDVYFGYRLRLFKYDIQELDYRWNHMSMFSEEWNNSPSRFDSYIIHYAGNGHVLSLDRTEQIIQDYNLLKRFDLLED